jgi:hypothetical protein
MTVTGAQIVREAERYLGVPYLYGGDTSRGLDCSGLVYLVCRNLGITSCPRTSEEQWAWCSKVAAGHEQTGDLVFITGAEADPSPGHVMIVVNPGNPDKVIDAPYTGTVVRYDTYSRNGTGVNHLVGYGKIPGVTPSPTGASSTQPTAASVTRQNAAAAIGAVAGTGFAFLLLGLVLIPGVFLLYKAVFRR